MWFFVRSDSAKGIMGGGAHSVPLPFEPVDLHATVTPADSGTFVIGPAALRPTKSGKSSSKGWRS